ncbi:2'-5' RNA ligase [Gottfriedia luciferensis]|uniref:2'-5' RNA ligase n=1 Tax=Gottfriedia luciferensis TaxID=178774 RepID=A0ABX2ZZ92_9BACI|nr:RNA ligase family protein [Gottfriedia luciferensis]ODG93955.1 2'-5' RNA ligase [Gottfriedia luciferensis]
MKIKYPKTFHLPWSESKTSDDKTLHTIEHFIGKEVVVTEKIDGENCSIYRDAIHARSTDSLDHPSRHWVKMLQATIGYQIPEHWRVCGENVYAMHSILYEELDSYFYIFSIWDEQNKCLSWEETIIWSELLGLKTAPVLYKGVFNEEAIKACYTKKSNLGGEQEGYVIRLTDGFQYNDFKYSVAKFVRENHVQTDKHWMTKQIKANRLKQE